MGRKGAVASVVIAGSVALGGCSPGTPAPAETVTVTVSPMPAPTVTATVTVEPPTVYVPYDGYTILLGEGATRDDAALVAAFVELALDPATVPDGLSFAEGGVQLGSMSTIYATRTPTELRSRSAWQVGTADTLLFERSGPFSAIEPVRQWVVGQDPAAQIPHRYFADDPEAERSYETGAFMVHVGPHRGCPYDIDGVPPGMESAHQVWLESVGELVSCASGWVAVDLFVLDGEVAAVTVELGSP